MLKKPKPLKKGDLVALTAPSSPVSPAVLERAVESIRSLDLEPAVMPSCRMSHGYLSGSDRQRAEDVNRAFAAPSIQGIFCLRGGFGATRILPLLDYDAIRERPKAFIGYSDATALHTAFNQLCGFVTFHGPMPSAGYGSMDSGSLDSLKRNIFSDKPPGLAVNPPGASLETIYPGKARGIVTGGNLSLLVGTLGSPYEVDARDKILFLEEVGERPYRLDKALTALSLAGKFRDCAGIILGTFTECEEPVVDAALPNANASEELVIDAALPNANASMGALSLHEIFDEVIRPWGKPTIANFRAGHVDPQITIPLGTMTRLDAESAVVRFE